MEGNVAAIDGVRAVSTLSMVALHTVMLSTMHTTLGTREWTGYVHNSIYGLSTMAAFQVSGVWRTHTTEFPFG
jgi:surface polysaccharide O-acyltransferase-like enzyme